ncbi:hypothetical protein [Natrinema sp. CGMCC1.2065]|uniref:hypothetical protein n=1 Tax=Natrinema sp. CGMCC1.2065 TaxID=3445767 RepID=UPI003F49DE44
MNDSSLRDRVREVLHDADERSGSLVTGDDGDADSDLLETAREADDILESADPDDLLGAVGLDTLEDGSEPDSIPEAIARGEQERVADLQRLLRLSRLADRADDGGLGDAVGELQDAIGERAESAADTDENAGDADGKETADGETMAGSDTLESTESESGAESSTDDLGDGLRSVMRDSFADFGDEVSQLKARLEERRAGAADSDADDTTAGDEAAAAEAEAADEDEGLLGSGLGGDRERGTASGGPSRHSTMAPPPSQRADMRGTARHSTMPDKRG